MKYVLLFLVSFPLIVFAQKNYSVTIKVPSYLEKSKLSISCYNGKETKKVPFNSSNNSITIKDKYYSLHVVIEISYPADSSFKPNVAIFFVDDKPAQINFIDTDVVKNIAGKTKLKNAVNAGNNISMQELSLLLKNEDPNTIYFNDNTFEPE